MPSRGELITAAHDRRRRLIAMLVNGPVASSVCRAAMGVSKDVFDQDIWQLKQRGIIVPARLMNPLTGRTGIYAIAWTGKPLGEPGKWARPIGDEEAEPSDTPLGMYVPTPEEIAAECAKIRAERRAARDEVERRAKRLSYEPSPVMPRGRPAVRVRYRSAG